MQYVNVTYAMSKGTSRAIAKRPTLRQAQSEAVHTRLLDSAMALCERGEEPTMRAVAELAGISERTIYRYFENRDALFSALRPRFMGRTGIPLCATADGLEAYATALFSTFEANRELTIALVTAPWAAPYMTQSRAKNLEALRKLLDEAYPHAAAADRAAAASSLRVVLSGAGWHYLRVGSGLSAQAVTRHALWLLGTVRARLQAARAA